MLSLFVGLLCQHAAHLTIVIEKNNNTVHISFCLLWYIISNVSEVFLYGRRKGKTAAVESHLKRVKERHFFKYPPLATWGHYGHKQSSFHNCTQLQQRLVLPLCPAITSLQDIPLCSLTHILLCDNAVSRWLKEGIIGHYKEEGLSKAGSHENITGSLIRMNSLNLQVTLWKVIINKGFSDSMLLYK